MTKEEYKQLINLKRDFCLINDVEINKDKSYNEEHKKIIAALDEKFENEKGNK